MSPQQKGWITRKANEYAEVLKHPENFEVKTVKKRETLRDLKASGYQTTKTKKVIIPLHTSDSGKFDSARIVKGKIIFKGSGLTETVTPSTVKDFHKKLKTLADKKLKNNQMLTVKIGDSASFNSRFDSYADLYKYLTQTFNPKPGKDGKKIKGRDLMRYMSIVEVKNEKPQSNRNTPKANKEKSHKNTKQSLTRK